MIDRLKWYRNKPQTVLYSVYVSDFRNDSNKIVLLNECWRVKKYINVSFYLFRLLSMTTEFQICPLQQEFLSKSWTKMTMHQSFKSIPIRLEFSAQRQEVSKIQSIEYMPWTKTRVLMLSYHTGCKESEPVNSMWRKPVVKSMLMKLSLDHIVLGCVLKCCFHEI